MPVIKLGAFNGLLVTNSSVDSCAPARDLSLAWVPPDPALGCLDYSCEVWDQLWCAIQSDPLVGIDGTQLPLPWTPDSGLPTLCGQLSVLPVCRGNSWVPSYSGGSGMTHTTIWVELGVLLETFYHLLTPSTCTVSHSVRTLGRACHQTS